MKIALSLFVFSIIGLNCFAQQDYLLLPADTPGKVKINEGELLKRISNQKVKVNRINKFDGFRIEIYQGNDRKVAQEVLEKFIEENPNIPAALVFEKPYVKVKVGIFRTKLEAQPLFHKVKHDFDGSKIVFGKGLPFPPLNNRKKEKEVKELNRRIEDF